MTEIRDAQEELSALSFNGNTSEYFRIWIVNLALTIMTLGVYSAWAKVRKERYFYTHTSLAGGQFDYHAKPKAILFGRIIAVIVAAIYFGSSLINPLAPIVVIFGIFLISPWLVVRSRIFRMRVSSYRGIRFNFNPAYREAFKVYYLAALIYVASLGLATPRSNRMRNEFAVANSGFGQTRFAFNGELSQFVAIFWKSFGIVVLAIFGSILFSSIMTMGDYTSPKNLQFQILIGNAPLLIGYLLAGVYYQVRLRNHIWCTTTLGDNEFISTLSVKEMFFIYLTNILAIVFSLGLLVPWAQIRLAKYRADHLQVRLAADWEDYLAARGREGSALGDEVGEAFDVDIDLGF